VGVGGLGDEAVEGDALLELLEARGGGRRLGCILPGFPTIAAGTAGLGP
jgi:hypothetical protein